MGDSKTKTLIKPSRETIYPWLIYTEPSVATPHLIRLCLSHQESDRFIILETYYPDEIENAVIKGIQLIHLRKHMLTLEILEEYQNPKICKTQQMLCRAITQSRSTDEIVEKCKNETMLHANYTFGIRPV